MTQMTSHDKPILIDSHGQVVPHDGLLGIFPGDAWHLTFFLLEDRYYLMCMESMYDIYIYVCDVCKSLCIQNTKTIMIFKYIYIYTCLCICMCIPLRLWHIFDLYRHRLVFSEAPFALTMHWLQLWAIRFHQTWWNSTRSGWKRRKNRSSTSAFCTNMRLLPMRRTGMDWIGFTDFLRMNHWHIMLFNH